jgi:type VI secretion system secreted protein VgrG
MARSQKYREVATNTSLGEDVLLLRDMTMTEELGRLFSMELELFSADENINFEALLGQNATIRLAVQKDKTRYFNGFITDFSQTINPGEPVIYQATLKPWLWFLTRTSDCRIFQDKTTPDIIKKIFRDLGYTDFEEKLKGEYVEWDYCVQYRETDFNFVSRLMEQEGIYYFFKHKNGKHILVLADFIGAHELLNGYEKIPSILLMKQLCAMMSIFQPGCWSNKCSQALSH